MQQNCPLNVEIGGQALPALSRQAQDVDTAKEIKAMTNTIAPSSIALGRSLAAVARFWRSDAKVAGTSRAILQSDEPDLKKVLFTPGPKIVLQHRVIPGSSRTKARESALQEWWGQPDGTSEQWRATMVHYVGLDVSLKQTSICV
jgi:hypothetical protein